jgi:hypothetical protein
MSPPVPQTVVIVLDTACYFLFEGTMALDSFRKKLKDTKRVIRSCKLKKERHTKCIYNDQKKKKWIKIMIYKNYHCTFKREVTCCIKEDNSVFI